MTNSDPASKEEQEVVAFLAATLVDIQGLEFEGPLENIDSANCHILSNAYKLAAELHEKLGDEAALPAARIFAMLSAVCDFSFHPSERNTPYSAMSVFEGRRSAIPEDFRGAPVEVLAYAAERSQNPVLKARLSDVCWLLERKRYLLGRTAVSAYVAIVEGLDAGRLKEGTEDRDPVLGLAGRDALQRALALGRGVGWDSEEVVCARDLLSKIRGRALKDGQLVPIHWFFEMDLDFGISAPGEIATELEAFLDGASTQVNSHVVVDLWRLAARAHHHAKNEDAKYRCLTAAAEALVAEAEKHTSAMLASHWLSGAIAEYHGVPDKRQRRTELRHNLVDVQSGIADEMVAHQYRMDIGELVKSTEQLLEERRELIDLLFLFANLDRSPPRDKLIADAIQAIAAHPLASIFGTSFHDNEGKVIYRAEGGGLDKQNNYKNDAVRVQIAQAESFRREILVATAIEVTRRHIAEHYYISDDIFRALLRRSPFVPHDLIETYSRGFARFFAGDFPSGAYILTPLLENSLRHVLKLAGHEVTKFDAAKQVQEDRTISVLFEQQRRELEETFSEAIVADIDHVFLSKPGPHFRHAVAHGLLNDSSPYSADAIYACWLIFRLCCIPLFPHRSEITLPH